MYCVRAYPVQGNKHWNKTWSVSFWNVGLLQIWGGLVAAEEFTADRGAPLRVGHVGQQAQSGTTLREMWAGTFG